MSTLSFTVSYLARTLQSELKRDFPLQQFSVPLLERFIYEVVYFTSRQLNQRKSQNTVFGLGVGETAIDVQLSAAGVTEALRIKDLCEALVYEMMWPKAVLHDGLRQFAQTAQLPAKWQQQIINNCDTLILTVDLRASSRLDRQAAQQLAIQELNLNAGTVVSSLGASTPPSNITFTRA